MREKLLDIIKPASDCITENDLLLYAQGMLPPDHVRKVEEHLSGCEFCSDALDGIMYAGVEKSKQAIDAVNSEIQKRITPVKTFPLKIVLRAAAVIFFIALSGWLVNILLEKPADKIFSDQFELYPPPQDKHGTVQLPPVISDTMKVTEVKPEVNNSRGEKEVTDKTLQQNSESVAEQKQSDDVAADENTQHDMTRQQVPATVESDAIVVPQEEAAEVTAFEKTSVVSDTVQHVVKKKSNATEDQYAAQPGAVRIDSHNAYSEMENTSKSSVQFFSQGLAYYQADNFTAALTEFQKVLMQDPSNEPSNFYSGVSSLALKRPDEALKFFEKTDNKGGQFYEATLWYQSLAYISKEDRKQAKRLLEKVVELNGEYRTRAEETLKQL